MIIFIIFSIIFFIAAVCAVFKSGEKDGICKYGYMEEENK